MSTCRRLRDLVLETCFNVHALLAVFFGDKVQQFRLMQWMTGTVVSGSVVLQYFNRFRWRGCDLDIYIHPGCAAGPIRFLLESGYTFAPRDPQYRDPFLQAARPYPAESLSYLGRGIADVLDFQNGDKKVQAIVTKHTPMETILGFHTTCVMNVLTYNHAFALYPRSTFIHKEALVIKTDGAKQESGRQKYVDRGWKMSGVPSLDNKSEVAVRLLRWPGDPFTWTLSLPEIPLRSTELVAVEPTDLCTTNSWQLDSCSGVVVTKWVRVEDASLRYKYIVADRDSVTAAVGKLPYVNVHRSQV
ncbi:hypothetical protein C8R47DRAFT_1039998 [Mycena vitilis]|nr:hypothetical protein C8R47DRAFT_1039998 [Mycena vitilis]